MQRLDRIRDSDEIPGFAQDRGQSRDDVEYCALTTNR
jgi:hypothetical protein